MIEPDAYWGVPVNELLIRLASSATGLTQAEALKRKNKPGRQRQPAWVKDFLLFTGQFRNPLILILIFAVILSAILGEHTNTIIILGTILLSSTLGFWQERNAGRAVEKLRAIVQVTATVVREGITIDIPAGDVVPGDFIVLNAGDIIPGDGVLLEANDLHVNEATLSGESFPAEKQTAILPIDTPLPHRKNCIFQGTSVVNGSAKALMVMVGENTEFGKIAKTLEGHLPETAFEKGIRKFGYMLMRITLLLSLFILVLNIFLGKPVAESILFALALTVGMAPELLPAIVTITLSAGAKRMAEKNVIVKKLSSIQNLGAVDVFCSDKTGTLTEGVIEVQETVDIRGIHSDKVRQFAFLNANFETGYTNPLDEAIRKLKDVVVDDYKKSDEVPYDFIRKRISIVVVHNGKHIMITKGAVKTVLDVCDTAEIIEDKIIPLEEIRKQIEESHQTYSTQGLRTLGVCYKDVTEDPIINKDDETEMTFIGFIILTDPLKPNITETLSDLKHLGITLKLITGDNKLVTTHLSDQIGLRSDNILTGSDLRQMSADALSIRVKDTEVFAETEPDQKERLVRALQKNGNVVGYIGDGINDVTALKTADVGITVDSAVDIAKDTADIVFLQKDLNVLKDGILEGRETFINTLKYIYITTSANFGNMFSMAGTSLLLPFLPLLPKQILLTNLLTDVPAMGIASDRVDNELIQKPQKWNDKLIKNFMIVFGLQSSIFDFLTFGTLLWFFEADAGLFRTGWFLESVLTEILILLVIRTQRPVFKSHPGKFLIVASCFTAAIVIILPYTSLSNPLGFVPIPLPVLIGMASIALIYVLATDITKRMFFRSTIKQ
ncbi:magnesium-translocating P-type ATPase [Chryseolinea sp. H1M3-3]|uniref:magnesium-translocating P-type ATPase n=1 Tax=Chryseolinea sp. H1M3-3 TaxID=3034144 RepID=UPI0023EB0281|nr:magnesium-translocating P-type ATPase [Chryseolinea sp. H1M3-3]